MIIYNLERKRTIKIYWLMIALICLDAFLKSFVPSTIIRFLELFCVLNTLYLCFKMHWIRRLKSLKISFWLLGLALIGLSIVIRGDWSGSIKSMVMKFSSPLGGWLYLAPFVILSLPNRKYFKDIVKVFFYASLLTIPLWLLNLGHVVEKDMSIAYRAESIGVLFPFFAGFLLALRSYFSKKQYRLIIFIWLVYLFIMLLNARRNVSFSMALYGVIAYFFYMFSQGKASLKNKVVMVFLTAFMLIFLTLNMSNLQSGLFSRMTERAGEDTRSGVTEWFFLDFMHSPWQDWAFGRGMDGTYYQPVVNIDTGEETTDRNSIETGYLNMMLRGGIVYDVIIIMILLLAIIRCFRQRHNMDMVYIGVFLCTYLLDLYSTNPLIPFSVRLILFWFCISVSISKHNVVNDLKYERIYK